MYGIKKIKDFRWYGTSLLFIVLSLRGDCLTLRALFDVLFPSTSFKSLLVHCVRLHGMLDTLHQTDRQDRAHLHEIFGLNLVLLEKSVDNLSVERIKFRTQDLEDLLIMLDRVIIRVQEICEVEENHRDIWVNTIGGLQQKIDRML